MRSKHTKPKLGARPVDAKELKKLAVAKLRPAGAQCGLCRSLDKRTLAAINQCLREGVSIVGMTRALREKGFAQVTISKLTGHKTNGHHKA
jgi:bacterioferritin-associated ferredoxin